ncbi:MAG: hypothetical protein WA624_19640, partial [Methylocella sp.]
ANWPVFAPPKWPAFTPPLTPLAGASQLRLDRYDEGIEIRPLVLSSRLQRLRQHHCFDCYRELAL